MFPGHLRQVMLQLRKRADVRRDIEVRVSCARDGHLRAHLCASSRSSSRSEIVDRISRIAARSVAALSTFRWRGLLEAAASGLATVGTSVGYVADWHPDRAVAVPVQHPEALANAIADLLADSGRRQRLASAAREWTVRHDADWTAAQFEQIYREVRLKPDTTEERRAL